MIRSTLNNAAYVNHGISGAGFRPIGESAKGETRRGHNKHPFISYLLRMQEVAYI